MNNMPYPFMPDANMMNIPYQYGKIPELEQRISKLEREVRKIQRTINNIDIESQKPLTSKKEVNLDDDDGIYMM